MRARTAAVLGVTWVVLGLASAASAEDDAASALPGDASDSPGPEPRDGWSQGLREGIGTVVESRYHRLSLDVRGRVEVAKQDDFHRSEAYTLRTRAGLGTQPWQGLSAFAEVENVVSFDDGAYFNAVEKFDGQTVIPDPEETELNRLFVSLDRPDWWQSQVVVGRQRIRLDDLRFIGNRGWRQNEQTFDAALGRSSFGIEELTFTYAYLRRTRRPFGRDGPVTLRDFGGESHLLHGRWQPSDGFALTGFAYLLDLALDDAPDPSSQSYGFRAAFDPELNAEVSGRTRLSFALQKEYGGRSDSYDTFYLHFEQGFRHVDWGGVLAGVDWLGSDRGTQVFETPLANVHPHNGWADVFGDNGGPKGLRDVYVEVAPRLPFDLRARIIYHHFWSDDGDKSLGNEIDAELVRRFGPYVEARAKMGWFDSNDNERQDTWRAWLEITLRV